MCLDTVDVKTKKGRGYGYKVLARGNGKTYTYFKEFSNGIRNQTRVTFDKWLIDDTKGDIGGLNKKYKAGWHIFVNLTEVCLLYFNFSRDRIVRKVRYEDVTASGKWCGCEVIVARKMYICKGEVK